MANIRLIKRRIRSVQGTSKITKAMEMIAASKMRRAQQHVLAGRPYADKIGEVLAHLAALPHTDDSAIHPLLRKHPEVKRVAVVHITPDRGLCGGMDANVNRHAASFILEQEVPVTVIAVGRKGRDYMTRFGRNVRAEFSHLPDAPSLMDTTAISHIVREDYISGIVDRVVVTYAQFVNTVMQRPVVRQILPVEPAKPELVGRVEYIYEPTSFDVLQSLLPRFVEMQIYHAILESIASEQSARMVAMRNATDNAKEMIQELTLLYNKARQEMITTELLDITAGSVSES
ncbi:MAG: ATP synthase F1 subunit gamma [Chloroflexi bacterium]|nr:ATP synthase F1 subunit gamma [Chloroflexota bacterium]